jgi:hypothetical protein
VTGATAECDGRAGPGRADEFNGGNGVAAGTPTIFGPKAGMRGLAGTLGGEADGS